MFLVWFEHGILFYFNVFILSANCQQLEYIKYSDIGVEIAYFWRHDVLSLPKAEQIWQSYAWYAMQNSVKEGTHTEGNLKMVLFKSTELLTSWFNFRKSCKNTKYTQMPVWIPAQQYTCDSHVTSNTNTYLQLQPFGKICVLINYEHLSFSHNYRVFSPTRYLSVLRYSYSVNKLFGIHINFTKFSLSDICLEKSASHNKSEKKFLFSCAYKDTEFLMLHQEDNKLYFCMKRPQWTIFTGPVLDIDYHICMSCVNQLSQVEFSFQLVGNYLFRTTFDDYRKILSSGVGAFVPLDVTCVMLNSSCHKGIFKVFIRGEKYNFLWLREFPYRESNIFIEGYNEQHIKFREISPAEYFKAERFYVTLLILDDFYNTPAPTRQVWYYLAIDQGLLSMITLNPNLPTNRYQVNVTDYSYIQMLARVTTPTKNYIRVQMEWMSYRGLTVHSCFFGGFSLYENKDISLPVRGQLLPYQEVFTLCSNYTQLENASQISTHYERIRIKPFIPYTSATKDIILVFHCLDDQVFNASVTVSLTECRGLLINPCNNKIFPDLPNSEVLTVPNTESHCITAQFSLQFLSSTDFYDQDVTTGCRRGFTLYKSDRNLCGVRLFFLQFFERSPILKYHCPRGVCHGDTFLFSNTVWNNTAPLRDKQQFQCAENVSNPPGFIDHKDRVVERNEWYRGLKIFHTFMNMSQFAFSVHRFSANIKLSYIEKNVEDKYFVSILPFTESLSTLTMVFKPCTGPKTMSLPSGLARIDHLQMGSICLRKPVLGVLGHDTKLELLLQGEFLYLSGTIQINTLFCFDHSWKGILLMAKQRSCSQNKIMRWSALLNYNYFYTTVLILLRGKIFIAAVNTSNAECKYGDCFLRFRWNINPHFETQEKTDNFTIESRTKKSGDLHSSTWYEAHRVCAKKDTHLPSFVSERELDVMKTFLGSLSYKMLIETLFIGIIRKVCEKRKLGWALMNGQEFSKE